MMINVVANQKSLISLAAVACVAFITVCVIPSFTLLYRLAFCKS